MKIPKSTLNKIGFKPHITGLVDSKTGKAWKLPSSRPLLILVAGTDSPPSDAAVRQLSLWSGEIRQAGGTLAIISESKSASEAHGLPFSPSQAAIEELSAPATPTMFLINREGKVVNLWMGYDATTKEKLRADILKALSGSR